MAEQKPTEFPSLLSDAEIDERGGRAGFPPEVLSSLLALTDRHLHEFGLRDPGSVEWDGANRGGGR